MPYSIWMRFSLPNLHSNYTMHVQNIYKHLEIYISNFSIGEETTLFRYASSFYNNYFKNFPTRSWSLNTYKVWSPKDLNPNLTQQNPMEVKFYLIPKLMNLTLVLLDSNFIRSKAKRLKPSLPKFEPHTSRGGFKLISNHQTIIFVVITSFYFLILVLNGSSPPISYSTHYGL